jgi:RNA polymerase sigma-70 factor (ECF subfamily)
MFEAKIDCDQLATLLRAGDEGTYEFVIQHLAKVVIQRLVRLGFSYEDAKDICGDCLLKLWATIRETYYPNRAALLSWLLTVAGNLAIDQIRARKDARFLALYEAKDIPAKNGDGKESGAWDWELIEQAITLLRESDQDLIELKYGQGLTYAEIAEMHGTSPAAAGMSVTRAVRRLQKKIERLIADEQRRKNKRLGKTDSS